MFAPSLFPHPPQTYLEKAVHVILHVGDSHPLHDDVRDASLKRLPFVAGHPGGVNSTGTPGRGPQIIEKGDVQ